jgi:predicted RNase H-like HicB family nuclease
MSFNFSSAAVGEKVSRPGKKRKQMKTFEISIIIEPDDGRFHAYVPALKGLHVDGVTREEALRNACEAIIVYLDSMARFQDAFPNFANEGESR